MRLILMGTPQFSVPIFEALLKSENKILLVVTQKDKPKGRGLKVTPSAVSQFATKNNLNMLQIESFKEEGAADLILKYNPDMIIVAAFGLFIPKNIFSFPKSGCLNVHPSLLPQYRGPAPINWAIINGDKKTGVTIHYTTAKMDAGDIIYQEAISVDTEDTAETLSTKLSILSSKCILKAVELIKSGGFPSQKQDETRVSYAPTLEKKMGKINWEEPSYKIHNQVRGLQPWPGAFSYADDCMIKIYKTKILDKDSGAFGHGEIINCDKEGIEVATGQGVLKLLEVQFENKCRMMATDCYNGILRKYKKLGQYK